MRSARHAGCCSIACWLVLGLRTSQSWQSSRFTGLFLTDCDELKQKTSDNYLTFLPVSVKTKKGVKIEKSVKFLFNVISLVPLT